MRHIIKHILLGLSTLLIATGIGSLANVQQTTANADETTNEVKCQVDTIFQSENDPNITKSTGTLTGDLSDSYTQGCTYNDILKSLSVQQLKPGYTLYDFLNACFDYANGITGPDETLDHINAMSNDMSQYDLKKLEAINDADLSLFPNASVDMTATRAEAQQVVTPKWDADNNTYWVPTFIIYVVDNNYQMTIKYVLPNGSPAHDDVVVTGYAGKAPATITSPTDVKGYVPDQSAVKVNFAKEGKYETVVHYVKPNHQTSRPATTDQASLTANNATITAGDQVTAATFNAKATDATGQALPVTLDLNQAKLTRPGTYKITLKAANGKTLTVTLTVKAAEAARPAILPKQSKVYALKILYLYQHPTFNRHQRLAKYPKANRTKRPMFVVTNYAYSKAGRLRYQVKDINAKSKTAGKTGYVTAKKAFIALAYYQQAAKQIKVISKTGINVYTDLSLTKKVKHVKTGRILKVTGIQHYNLTTRFKLNNNQYITANRKLVMVTK
ncbi:DUF5776 domain-containing protein [Levilactobacillus angrenensis]|uniref:DUF5776 domain-containing protein n=1 Tax=Levilactobacillus angrenensis TaxID=2486020 RepID=A0ABW1U7K5_9LACO|nr:DUF5776 domain-containing protein [Levilactobacillus angrenensis]